MYKIKEDALEDKPVHQVHKIAYFYFIIRYSSTAKYINYFYDPIYQVVVNKMLRISIFATRNIKKNKEITIDYQQNL